MKGLVLTLVEGATIIALWLVGGWPCAVIAVVGWWASNLIKRFWRE